MTPQSLSIILTVYQCSRRDNGVEIFQRTLDSLTVAVEHFRRVYPSVVLDGAIVDDGSTDDTVAIAQTWTGSLTYQCPWQIFVQPQNGGQAAARNRGARETSGDILCFCDDDDVYFPQHFLLIYEGFHTPLPLAAPFLKDLPGDRPAIVSTGIQFSDPIHPAWQRALEGTMAQNHGIRRTLHNFIGGFPEDPCFRSGGEDIAYSRWAETFGRRHHIGTPTLKYCRYPGSHFDRQLDQFRRSPDFRQLCENLRHRPDEEAIHQARTDVYNQRHRELTAAFTAQWLPALDTHH